LAYSKSTAALWRYPWKEVLEDGLEVLPHLVLDALRATPLLLQPGPHYEG